MGEKEEAAEKVSDGANEDSFCLVIIKLKFIICHPVFNVRVTLSGASQEALYIVR